MPINDRTEIARRMEAVGLASGQEVNPDLPPDPWQPRWRIEANWIEFECGCRAERCLKLSNPKTTDPIIFGGTNQQAVYDFVCSRHMPGMNKWMGFGGPGLDFDQWRRYRRQFLMGKVKP
jgi:hypothetical protein